MSNIVFSHRPAAGISVAATVTESGEGRFAVAFRHRRLNPNHDRRVVNDILRARLERGRDNGFVFSVGQVNGDAHDLMGAFRQVFKPMVHMGNGVYTENPFDFFSTNQSIDEKLNRITSIAQDVAQQLNSSGG